jgi:hypothetical protein
MTEQQYYEGGYVSELHLPPERRLRLYLNIARKVRPYPWAKGVRREAVRQAWSARQDLRRQVH